VPPDGLYSDIEQALAEKYGLIDAAIAEPMVDDEPSLLAALGSVAASYLGSTLTEHERLGISPWSATLLNTVNSMAPPATVRLASDAAGRAAPGRRGGRRAEVRRHPGRGARRVDQHPHHRSRDGHAAAAGGGSLTAAGTASGGCGRRER
jgi:Putative sugar-binding domain